MITLSLSRSSANRHFEQINAPSRKNSNNNNQPAGAKYEPWGIDGDPEEDPEELWSTAAPGVPPPKWTCGAHKFDQQLATCRSPEAFGAFHVRFYQPELRDGQLTRVQKSHRLCAKDRKHYSPKSKPVQLLCDDLLRKVNTATVTEQDTTVAQFWEKHYLPYCEEMVKLTGEPRKKVSTIRGYKQIWKQHLEAHFGKLTLQEYEPHLGTRFLQSLTGTQAKNTLKHVRACASSLFKRAVNEQRIKTNPWHEVQMPDDAIESSETQHYTLEEAENIISALVDHVDCQLVMALSCFLGLRPGEIAALRWEDFDPESVNIRRSSGAPMRLSAPICVCVF